MCIVIYSQYLPVLSKILSRHCTGHGLKPSVVPRVCFFNSLNLLPPSLEDIFPSFCVGYELLEWPFVSSCARLTKPLFFVHRKHLWNKERRQDH